MYLGKNPTALKSQEWICDSLATLMETKPYKKISIKEITEHSQLSRQTFYQLFDSKEEILTCTLNRRLNTYYKQFLTHYQTLTSRDLSGFYVSFTLQNKQFIQQLIENNLTTILIDAYSHYIKEIKQLMLHPDKSEETITYHSIFIAYGLVGIIIQWFANPLFSKDELHELLTNLVDQQLKK